MILLTNPPETVSRLFAGAASDGRRTRPHLVYGSLELQPEIRKADDWAISKAEALNNINLYYLDIYMRFLIQIL